MGKDSAERAGKCMDRTGRVVCKGNDRRPAVKQKSVGGVSAYNPVDAFQLRNRKTALFFRVLIFFHLISFASASISKFFEGDPQ